MALCGLRTPARGKLGEAQSTLDQRECGQLRRSVARGLAGFALFGLLIGCAPTMKYGSPPKTDRLAALQVGVSSTADVLLALGEPRGYGMTHLSADPSPRKIWFYEFTKVDGSRVDLTILLVFFGEERYHGHLWFSSAGLLTRKE